MVDCSAVISCVQLSSLVPLVRILFLFSLISFVPHQWLTSRLIEYARHIAGLGLEEQALPHDSGQLRPPLIRRSWLGDVD